LYVQKPCIVFAVTSTQKKGLLGAISMSHFANVAYALQVFDVNESSNSYSELALDYSIVKIGL
jgi:hypothetical protein